jgi:ADP-ribose pyrophosphatase YjhB (NUDIX family)
MNRYLIAAAVIRDRDRILLVQQQSKNDPSPSWALPGGVVEDGELLHEALKRVPNLVLNVDHSRARALSAFKRNEGGDQKNGSGSQNPLTAIEARVCTCL